MYLGLSCGSDSEESYCNVEDLGSMPGLEDSLEGGHDNPLQYSCLENPHVQRSLAGYSPWGRKELDTTEQLSTTKHSVLEGCRDFVLTGKSGRVIWYFWPQLILRGR